MKRHNHSRFKKNTQLVFKRSFIVKLIAIREILKETILLQLLVFVSP